jgi:hypothetical protein
MERRQSLTRSFDREHRLAGIWLKFKSVYLRDLMQRLHRQKIIAMTSDGNHISMNTHLRFGFELFRIIFVTKVFGKSNFLRRTLRGDKMASHHWISVADSAGTR